MTTAIMEHERSKTKEEIREEIARFKGYAQEEFEEENLKYILQGLQAYITSNDNLCLEAIVYSEEYIKILKNSDYENDASLTRIDIECMEEFLEECEERLDSMKKFFKKHNPCYEYE